MNYLCHSEGIHGWNEVSLAPHFLFLLFLLLASLVTASETTASLETSAIVSAATNTSLVESAEKALSKIVLTDLGYV